MDSAIGRSRGHGQSLAIPFPVSPEENPMLRATVMAHPRHQQFSFWLLSVNGRMGRARTYQP